MSISATAPSSVTNTVTVAGGASIWFNAVLRGDVDRIEEGEDSNVQDGSIVHMDEGSPALIGARVTIGHRAVVHGCVVEDECLVAEELSERLARLGMMVCAAETGDQALAAALDSPPDLVLMDIRLKGRKDGIETAAELKERLPRGFVVEGDTLLKD